MSARFPYGARLELRGHHWVLACEQQFEACRVLTLHGADAANANQTLRVIEPFDRPRAVVRPRLRRRPRRAVLRAALGALASARTEGGLWAAAAAAIDILPYQLEPALAVVGGATRVLLADAVGLGKTIQAGLIVAELQRRGWCERTLIVCPSGLREAWASELRDRFGVSAAIFDHATLAHRMATLPPGSNPWASDPIVVVSIDLLKRPEVLAAVDRVPIDLLIADEAHHLAPGTDRGAAVARLAGRAPWVVMLSATPHSGDAAAFSYLTAIGRHHDALRIFRRTRQDAGSQNQRRTHLLAVRPAGLERALLDAVDRYVAAIWHGRGRIDRAARLVAITLARRAASSAEALAHSLHRRLALLSGAVAAREPEQGLLPWDESDAADEIEGDDVLAAVGIDDPVAEQRQLASLLELARQCGAGSKIHCLYRWLRRIREPAIVFTEFRDTLQAIASGIDFTPCCVIHGGLPPEAKRDAISRFNNGDVSILLATDAAGEGLNLQHRCRLVIDIELPWNPLRLEQRIGRVDRIGQHRTVHAIRLFHPETIEARVLDHLRIRRRRADDALECSTSEQEVAEALFEGRSVTATMPLPNTGMAAAATGEAERISWQRSARALAASSATRCWAVPRSARLVSVHRTTALNDAGLPAADRIDVRCTTFSPVPANRREWQHAIEDLAEHPAVSAPFAVTPSTRTALTERIAAIRAMVAHRSLVEYQRSLFDGRADDEAVERDRTAHRIDAALERTRRATSAPSQCAPTELVAAWTAPRP